ncbi:MAG: hypothetical protein IPN95_01945 [Bacteroidetes bacterium]|nr:hypothetical protein [Bacteroidota bacterium]
MNTLYHDPKFDGTWTISTATNHLGQAYTGTMRIFALPRGGHGIQWETTAGEYEGIALAIEGQLYVAFGTEVGYGLAVYAEKMAASKRFSPAMDWKAQPVAKPFPIALEWPI